MEIRSKNLKFRERRRRRTLTELLVIPRGTEPPRSTNSRHFTHHQAKSLLSEPMSISLMIAKTFMWACMHLTASQQQSEQAKHEGTTLATTTGWRSVLTVETEVSMRSSSW